MCLKDSCRLPAYVKIWGALKCNKNLKTLARPITQPYRVSILQKRPSGSRKATGRAGTAAERQRYAPQGPLPRQWSPTARTQTKKSPILARFRRHATQKLKGRQVWRFLGQLARSLKRRPVNCKQLGGHTKRRTSVARSLFSTGDTTPGILAKDRFLVLNAEYNLLPMILKNFHYQTSLPIISF